MKVDVRSSALQGDEEASFDGPSPVHSYPLVCECVCPHLSTTQWLNTSGTHSTMRVSQNSIFRLNTSTLEGNLT